MGGWSAASESGLRNEAMSGRALLRCLGTGAETWGALQTTFSDPVSVTIVDFEPES